MAYVITKEFSSAVSGRTLIRARYVTGKMRTHVLIVGYRARLTSEKALQAPCDNGCDEMHLSQGACNFVRFSNDCSILFEVMREAQGAGSHLCRIPRPAPASAVRRGQGRSVAGLPGGPPCHLRLYTEAPGPSRRKTPHEDPGAGILGLQFRDCRPDRNPRRLWGCI